MRGGIFGTAVVVWAVDRRYSSLRGVCHHILSCAFVCVGSVVCMLRLFGITTVAEFRRAFGLWQLNFILILRFTSGAIATVQC
jgi:hypothetical protein